MTDPIFQGYEVVLLGGNGDPTVVSHSTANQILASLLDSRGITCFLIHHIFDKLISNFDLVVSETLRCMGPNTLMIGVSTTLLMHSVPKDPAAAAKAAAAQTTLDRFFGRCGEEVLDKFIKAIRAVHPNVKWVAGGTQITPSSAAQKIQNFDYACIGQGETMLLSLYDKLKSNTPIPGKQIGKVFVLNDDDLPYADFTSSSHTPAPGQVFLPGLPYFLEVARGCIFKCSYCHYRLNGKSFGDFTRKIATIRANLIHNYEKHGIQIYHTIDDTIVDSKEKMEMLRAIFKDLPFKVYWGGYHRLDLYYNRPEWVAELYELGCRGAFFGIETFHSKAGGTVGKGLGGEKILKTLALFREHAPDLHIFGAFIMGLNYEPLESIQNTHETLRDTNAVDAIKYYVLRVAAEERANLEWSKVSKMEADPEKFKLKRDTSSSSYWPIDSAFKSLRDCKRYVTEIDQDFKRARGKYMNRTTWFGHVSHMAAAVGSGHVKTPLEAFDFVTKQLYHMPAKEAALLARELSKQFKLNYWKTLKLIDHSKQIKLCALPENRLLKSPIYMKVSK